MTIATRVKICGITRVEDAGHAAAAGTDAIGIIFYPPSARYVADLGAARSIAEAAGPLVTVTALFVNPETSWVEQVLRQVPVNLLQFHGDESEEFCSQFGRPYMKAIAMKPVTMESELNVSAAIAAYGSASAILLDAYHPKKAGGTGETFDWSRVPVDTGKPIVLAGGLTPENVALAVAQVRPYAVDVSGGVEAIIDGQPSRGIKDSNKVSAFIRRAKYGEDQ